MLSKTLSPTRLKGPSQGITRMVKGFLAVAIAFLSVGCAVGQKIQYHATQLDLKAAGTCIVAVTALDDRAYVKNGEKDGTYVGTFRGGFGNPWNVTTESGKPLAEDMTEVLCASLKAKGFTAKPVSLKAGASVEAALTSLKTVSAKRLILLTILEWRSDTMTNTSLYYNLKLSVLDGDGRTLAEAMDMSAEESLGGSFMNPPGHAKEAVPAAFKLKLEKLMNDPKVVEALG